MKLCSKKLLMVLLLGALVAFAVACSPQTADTSDEGSGQEQGQTSGATWSTADDCAACHEAQQDSYTNTLCLISKHTQQTCMSCHEDDETLAAVHEKVSESSPPAKRLKKTKVADEVCLSCHTSWEDLSTATESVVILTDTNGTMVNPHEITTVHNGSKQHDSITCSSCHNMHAQEDVNELSKAVCSSCHHQNVYECGTCH